MKKIYEDLSPIVKRSNKILFLVEILLVVLVFYFWKIQILDHDEYLKQSEANRIQETVLLSPRGLIKDREDTILAKNIASFKASIIRENCDDYDSSLRRIARLLNLDVEVLKGRIKKYETLPLFKPIVFKDNLTIEEISLIEARKLEFPELVLQTEPKRSYPYNSFSAHNLGYIQELSIEEINSGINKDRRLGDLIGRTGLEKRYENLLKGTEGQSIAVVDSVGRNMGEISRKDPILGYDLKLTLDFDLQEKAEELLAGREGAAVVMDARNGEIMALASYPTYDPNKFINRFTPEEWVDLVNNPEFPLENRAIRGLYSPGSIFKLTMALAALDSNSITERTVFTCRGRTRIYGQVFSCWTGQGHGLMDLAGSIQHSCNIYFYNLGQKLGIEEIARYAKILGLGEKTGIDLPGEKEGLIPSPEWKRKTRNLPWYPGETISVSIGQGPILVTPLQIATHTSLIANRGERVTPHLLQSYTDPATGEEEKFSLPSTFDRAEIKRSSFEKVIDGMWKAVNQGGTARWARVEGFNVCGKTGSTQVISSVKAEELSRVEKEIKTHSWFTGFAPKDNPKIVVTVLVAYGGAGGEQAAPMARKLFELYREKND